MLRTTLAVSKSTHILSRVAFRFPQPCIGLPFQRHFHSTTSVNKQVAFTLPDVGEGIAEVEVLQWYIKEGDEISQFDKICEVQSDKATLDITSRFDGTVASLSYGVGDMAQTGSTLFMIDVEGGSDDIESTPPPPKDSSPNSSSTPNDTSIHRENSLPYNNSDGKVLATPAVRRLTKENELDISQIVGTGKDGRILKSDVLEYMNSSNSDSQMYVSSPPVFLTNQEDKVVPIKGVQRAMLAKMNEALKIPHFGYNDEFSMTALSTVRNDLQKSVGDARGIKITSMPILMKAASLALHQFPVINASISDDETSIKHHAAHNIAFAMDGPSGLIVPVISHVNQMSIVEIAEEMTRIIAIGQKGKLSNAELTGGTFTLSNIGSIGGTYASPIILPPQVAIGALGKVQKLPRFGEDVEAVEIMNVSWSADHRVIDGATMARFSNAMKSHVEHPMSMLSNLR